jgi:hypothetical protein
MSDDERPTPRRRGEGSGPRPAPDEHKDPIEPKAPAPADTDGASAAAPAPTASVRPRIRRGPQTVAQLNTRVDPILNDLVAEVSDQRGWTKRDVVEHALKTAYKAEYRALSSEAAS